MDKIPPRVSVAIITYQQVRYLEPALESIVSQDFDAFEVVVADDASTDGTRELLRDYERRYPGRVRPFFAERNAGPTANTNLALRNAQGEYVALMGGDDLMLPGRLTKQVAWLDRHPDAAICYTQTECFDDLHPESFTLQHDPVLNPMREARVEELFRSMTFFCGSSAMARRAFMPSQGCDARVPWVSDWLLWVETAKNGWIGFVPDVLTRYRVHSGGISRRGDTMLRDQLVALAIVESKYPDLIASSRLLRSHIMWTHAMRVLGEGDVHRAGLLLEGAFGQRTFGGYDARASRKWAYFVLTKMNLLGLVPRARRTLAEARQLFTRAR